MQQAVAVTNVTLPPPITGPSAWLGADMARSTAWLEMLSSSEIEEIDAAIRAHKASGRALGDITTASFALPTLGPRLKSMLQEVLNGRGFVLIRGFPVERYTTEEAAIAYLGMGAWFGAFCSQNAAGHLLGHVRDTGADISKQATRYYQTNRQLEYPTDSCDIVALMCLKTSRSGGESRIVSSVSLFNAMLERRPDLCAELFHAYPTD